MKICKQLFYAVLSISAVSCGEVPERTSPEPLRIILDREEPVYRVKVNEPLSLTPTVENAGGDTAYRWSIDGEVVGRESSFTFVGVEAGSVYIVFEAIGDNGQAEAEIRVDVMPVKFPAITMAIPSDGFSMLAGDEIEFSPGVDNAEASVFLWEVDGVKAADTKNYTFRSETVGEHSLAFTASNEDGTDRVEFTVKVCTEEQMAFAWEFEAVEYSVSLGRTVYIRPYRVENDFDAEYTWSVNGRTVSLSGVETRYAGTVPPTVFAFTPEEEGRYEVKVEMRNGYVRREQVFTVNCFPPQGTYRRPATGTSSEMCTRIYEFLPAAGQFVNDRYTANTMEEACAYAEERMAAGAYISLGAFGGYIVVGFDHSIANDGGYNIRVDGNSFTGSSEPGIVWVMQDENGNGIPDDTWYELRGSEYGGAETRLDYAVTYYRPSAPGQPVAWSDNEGRSGQVDYLPAFHTQDYYYPAWVSQDSYTLVGRKLKPRTEMVSETYWVNREYEWGYADNFSPVDRLDGGDNHNAGVNSNHFRISDAVTFEGEPAGLDYVDFVKIQTGVQAASGWLGEVSTEVCGVSDYNMIKTNLPSQ